MHAPVRPRRGVCTTRALIATLVVGLGFVISTAPAGAAGEVDLVTSLSHSQDLPVPGEPDIISIGVDNVSATGATNVTAVVTLPAGVSVAHVSDNCTAAAGHVDCTWPTDAAAENDGANIWVVFGTTGTKTFTSIAHADQPDIDNNSAGQLDVDVVDENADMAGTSEDARVVVGTQTTYSVFHQFTNHGPTAAANATVSGTVTGGGTIVPGSFAFVTDAFGETENLAADDCIVTATTFFCEPVFSGGVFYAPQPFISYDVTLPTTPATVVAKATLAGQADPVPGNNSSTITIEVDTPKAEISAQLASPLPVVPSGTPFVLDAFVENAGDIAATSVVADIAAPADWGIAPPSGPLPSGVSCSVLSSPRVLRCTAASLAAQNGWDLKAILTPPAGNSTGTVTLNVTTTSPEVGVYPNQASLDIRYAPNGQTRVVTVTPNTGLGDGNTVTLAGTGFNPGATVFYCQAIITGNAPNQNDCGVGFSSTTADGTGAFSTPVTVARFLVVNEVGVVDCAQPQAACGIGAADFFSPGGAGVVAPVQFTPQPPVADPFNARITGTVEDTSGHPVVGALVRGYRASDTWTSTLVTTTDANGNYVLEDAQPGITYRILFAPPAGSNLTKQWYAGPSGVGVSTRPAAFGLMLTAALPVVTADAVLTSGYTLSGTVTGPGGAPLAGVGVGGYRDIDRFVGGNSAITDANGHYTMVGVSPTTPIRIRFVPPAGSGFVPEWYDNVPLRAAATPVTVASTGTTANAQFGP